MTDKRQRPPYAVKQGTVPDTEMLTRADAAELMGVSTRTITRYASDGYLTKYTDARGRVRFSRKEVLGMNRFERESPPAL